jgi:WD40 repeat protein
VGVWDITKRRNELPRLEAMLKAHRQEVLCLRFNAHHQTFITGGNEHAIHVWSISSYQQLARLEGHSAPVTCLALDGNFLLSGAEDGVVHVWDLHSYMALATLKVHQAAVESLCVVPENGLLLSCSTDRSVRVWDYGLGREVLLAVNRSDFPVIQAVTIYLAVLTMVINLLTDLAYKVLGADQESHHGGSLRLWQRSAR